MAASPHVSLGPLPVAPHHRRASRRSQGRRSPGRAQRLFAAAVLGLTLPLAAASAAVALPSSAGTPPSGAESKAWSGAGADALPGAARPAAAPPWRPVPRPHQGGGFPQVHRHHPASLPERPDAAVEQAPDQVPEQALEQSVEQTPEQVPEQAPEQGVEAEPSESDGDGAQAGAPGDAAGPAAPDTVTAAGRPVAAVAAVPAILPARWRDASTTQLPLGVGLGLIGCGLGLVGLRLRKG
nr:hypothetical protein KitaXyl93_37010 [Kitasatospora sp. Xyl93]